MSFLCYLPVEGNHVFELIEKLIRTHFLKNFDHAVFEEVNLGYPIMTLPRTFASAPRRNWPPGQIPPQRPKPVIEIIGTIIIGKNGIKLKLIISTKQWYQNLP